MHSMPTPENETETDFVSAVVNLSRLVLGAPEGNSIAVTTEAWDRLLTCALTNGMPMVKGSGAIVTGPVVQLIIELASSHELALLPSKP